MSTPFNKGLNFKNCFRFVPYFVLILEISKTKNVTGTPPFSKFEIFQIGFNVIYLKNLKINKKKIKKSI